MSEIENCPRCGTFALEHLKTHSSCWECGYSPDLEPELSAWDQMTMPLLMDASSGLQETNNHTGLNDQEET